MSARESKDLIANQKTKISLRLAAQPDRHYAPDIKSGASVEMTFFFIF